MPKTETPRAAATAPSPGRVVVAGASGLIGTALVASLRADGVEVHTLVRRAAQTPFEHEWLTDSASLDANALDPALLDGASAVVALGGASIGRIPWTPSYKRELISSRLVTTHAIADAVRALGTDAPAFICASAVGFYGSQPGVVLDESGRRGTGFLADLVTRWEGAARTAGNHARIVHLRTAPVVHPDGVLAPLIRLTNAGLGGRLGRGTQVWPWISLIDEVRAIRHLIDSDTSGPVNLAGPQRATANDLGFALAVALNRPFLVPAPAFALRAVLGRDMADAVLLSDANVVPGVLQASGFTFTNTTVESAVDAAVVVLEERRAAEASTAAENAVAG